MLQETTNLHSVYRTYANNCLERYRGELAMQMEARNKKRPQQYLEGDLVAISVPRVDRNSTDRTTLPCKVLEILDNGLYRLGCKSGILDNCYNAAEILPLGPVSFPELDEIPGDRVSVRHAARSQASSSVTGSRCECRGTCSDMRCKCRKAGVHCNSGCHAFSKKCCNNDEGKATQA